jgi:hypothetical protein
MISPFPFDEPHLGWKKWVERNGDGNDERSLPCKKNTKMSKTSCFFAQMKNFWCAVSS